MVTQKLTIRLDEKELPEIRMVSGDVGREIQIEVYAREDSDTPIDLETYSAEITIIKPDNTFIMDNFDGDEYELPEQAGAVSGFGYYQIKIFTSGSRQIYTGQGPFLVDDMILSDDVIESSSIAFGDRFPEDFATKTWVDDEIEAAGIGTYVAGNPAGEETMPPLVRLQINDDIYPLIHKVEEQEDADITNPSEGDVLTYDADDQKWKNEPLVIPDPTVTKTATGNPIEITDGTAAPLVKCVTEIQGSQDLHGYDKPWVGGAGKNKCDLVPNYFYTQNGITVETTTDGEIWVHGTPTISSDYIGFPNVGTVLTTVADQTVTFSVNEKNEGVGFVCGSTNGSLNLTMSDTTRYKTGPYQSGGTYAISVNIRFDVGTIDKKYKLQIELGSTLTDWTPYKNICPITAYTEGEIEVSDGDGNTTTHTTTYPSAIYRGSEDVVNGEVTEEWKKIVFDGTEQWSLTSYNIFSLAISDIKKPATAADRRTGIVSSRFPVSSGTAIWDSMDDKSMLKNDGKIFIRNIDCTTVADFQAFIVGAELAYELATPTTSSVTPTNLPIKSLSGYNHIESSTGDMEVEYITQTYQPIVDLIQGSQHVYSTAEQIVGTWIDGKDVYERTIDLGSFSVGSWSDHTIESSTNINLLIDYSGYMVESNIMYALPDPSVRIKVDDSHNLIFTGTSGWNVASGYITIRYIKL